MDADLYERRMGIRPVDGLRRLFEGRGAGPERDLIAYCRMSHRAAVLDFTLAQPLGYGTVRAYDGTWTEWGNLVGVPVERCGGRRALRGISETATRGS